MNAKCWCCRQPVGRCVCQDQDTEICLSCHRCSHHCCCKQVKPAAQANSNRNRRHAVSVRVRPRIYVAGSRADDAHCLPSLREVIRVQVELIKAGFAPYCPRLIHGLDPGNTASAALWLEMDLPWLRVAAAVLRLASTSRDADREERFARQKGVPVFFTLENLLQSFEAQ